MAINYRDPRFQEALLRAGSSPTGNVQGLASNLTGAFAAQQQGVLNQFQNLATRQKAFDSNLQMANKRLALNTRKADWAMKMGAQKLKDDKDASRLGLYSGLGTSLVAGLIGRDRRKKTEVAAAEQSAFYNKLLGRKA